MIIGFGIDHYNQNQDKSDCDYEYDNERLQALYAIWCIVNNDRME